MIIRTWQQARSSQGRSGEGAHLIRSVLQSGNHARLRPFKTVPTDGSANSAPFSTTPGVRGGGGHNVGTIGYDSNSSREGWRHVLWFIIHVVIWDNAEHWDAFRDNALQNARAKTQLWWFSAKWRDQSVSKSVRTEAPLAPPNTPHFGHSVRH